MYPWQPRKTVRSKGESSKVKSGVAGCKSARDAKDIYRCEIEWMVVLAQSWVLQTVILNLLGCVSKYRGTAPADHILYKLLGRQGLCLPIFIDALVLRSRTFRASDTMPGPPALLSLLLLSQGSRTWALAHILPGASPPCAHLILSSYPSWHKSTSSPKPETNSIHDWPKKALYDTRTRSTSTIKKVHFTNHSGS